MICYIYDLPVCLTIWKLENWPKLWTQGDCLHTLSIHYHYQVWLQFFLLTFPWGWWSGLLSILHQLYWNSINTRGGNAFPILASHSKLVFCPTFWRQTASLWLCFKSFTQPTKLNIEVQKPLDLPLYDKLLVCLCSYRYSMFHFFLNCSGS